MAARLYLGFKTPPAVNAGEQGSAWTELGFAVLERINSVLHHYFLALEYRRGLQPALKELRQSGREIAAYLVKRPGMGEQLQQAKARYAVLWSERCEDVLPVYRELIGSGARGAIREALLIRPPELPLFAAWAWEERKYAEEVQKQFIVGLSSSTNPAIRMEGLLFELARARTDRGFSVAFANVLQSLDQVGTIESTRREYADVIRQILEDRSSRNLSDRVRSELRREFDALFSRSTVEQLGHLTVAAAATNAASERKGSGKGAEKKAKQTEQRASNPSLPIRPKAAPGWRALQAESELRYWETMPLGELRSLAATGDVLANYFVFLKLQDSDSLELLREAEAGLDMAAKAGFPQAELEFAKRQEDAEERFQWTRKSAETGYPAAQLALGKLHILGHGTWIDLATGLHLVRSAFDLRVPEAEYVLAELYASGIGEPRNVSERPEALFVSAARNNQAQAMLELHYRYLHGYGEVRDQLEASRWLVNICLHDKGALSKYLDASGLARPQTTVELDRFAKTLAVYAQAVVHKQPQAINRVAEWYTTGSIGRKSPVRAYAVLALASGPATSLEALERTKSTLTPQELRAAEILVAQWQRIRPEML